MVLSKWKKKKLAKGISLHPFPKNEFLRKAWIRAVPRKNWQPKESSRV